MTVFQQNASPWPVSKGQEVREATISPKIIPASISRALRVSALLSGPYPTPPCAAPAQVRRASPLDRFALTQRP